MFVCRLLLLFCLFFPVAISSAHDDITLKVGVFSVKPIAFIDSAGNAQGLYPDLIREIVRDEGWEVTFVPGTLAECVERLQSGQIDIMAPMAYTVKRTELYDFNKTPVLEVWGQVYVPPGSKVNSFDDLHGQEVAIVQAGVSGRNFVKISAELGVASKVVSCSSFDEVFQAVADGKVVAGVAPQHYGASHAKKFGLVPGTLKFSPQSLHFAALKGRFISTLKQIDAHLDAWKRDDSSFYYDRVGHWIHGVSAMQRSVSKWLLVGLTGTLLVSALLVYLNWALRQKATALSAESASESLARRKAEEELAAREQLYRRTHFSVEHSHSAMVWLDVSGRFVEFNHRFCSYSGYSREELIGMDVADICARCAEQFKELEMQACAEASVQLEAELIRKDRTQMWVLIEVSRFSFEGEEMLLAVVTDIEQRKKAELTQARLEAELRQSHKMEAIGTLAGGIAHDFNNILTSMIGCTEMALKRCADDQRLERYLQVVHDGELRAAELVAQILAFARQDEQMVKEVLSLERVVDEAMLLLRPSMPATAEIKRTSRLEHSLEVKANSSQLLQVVVNLVMNAQQALPGAKGEIEIVLEAEEVTVAQAVKFLKITPGDYLVLSVIDNGCGMSAEDMERAFDPYFTTRKQGEGTGFGLSIVQRVVQDHDGMVQVKSAPGEGSVFKVYFPVWRDVSEMQNAC